MRQFKNCFPDSSFKIQMSSDYVQQLTNMFWQFHLSSYILTYSQMHWFYTMRDSLNIMACEHNKVKKWFRTRGSPQLSNPYSALMPKSFQVLSNINSCTKTTYLYVNETEFQKIIHWWLHLMFMNTSNIMIPVKCITLIGQLCFYIYVQSFFSLCCPSCLFITDNYKLPW